MYNFKSVVSILALLIASPALGQSVYPGCTAPPASTGQTWYVDATNGKTPADGGNGSQATPWNSLNGVVSSTIPGNTVPGYTRPMLSSIPYYHVVHLGDPGSNPGQSGRVVAADEMGSPPVHPGDTILLMSGDYGSVAIGAYQRATVNSDWVTVAAAPGQKPVLDTLSLGSANKWIFRGIKVQSIWGTNNNKVALVTVTDQGAAMPTSDIIFQNVDVSSADDVSTWTQAQMVAQERLGLNLRGSAGNGKNGQPSTSCISVVDSHIHNIKTAATLTSNNTLFSGNEIDHESDDGILYAAMNLAITKNYIHDSQNNGDGNHEDGMQGIIGIPVVGVPFNTYSNILIDSNTILRQTEPNLPFPVYMQGIDAFDADWNNLTVTNNIIVTSSCYTTGLASLHNSLIAGNTALSDGLIVTPGCTASMIVGGKTHEGLMSSNVRVTNNLVDHLLINDQNAPTVTFDHNTALNAYQPIVHWDAAKLGWTYSYPFATDTNGNVGPGKTSTPYTSVFQKWSPATGEYDLHILPTSPTITRTANGQLPATDISGNMRGGAATPGAYGAF